MTPQKRWHGKLCLITGAAAGIGQASARYFSSTGARLCLVDIDREGLEVLAGQLRSEGTEVHTHVVDVAEVEQVAELAQHLERSGSIPHVLVNNAGVLTTGSFEQTDLVRWRRLFDVNFWGPLHAIKLLAPAMIARGSGAIVNVASVSALVPFSKLTAYSTTKYALLGLSLAMQGDLEGSGVTMSAVCPAFVKTDMPAHAGLDEAARRSAEELLVARGVDPAKVARAIAYAADSGKPIINVGKDAHILAFLARLAPTRASLWLSRIGKRAS